MRMSWRMEVVRLLGLEFKEKDEESGMKLMNGTQVLRLQCSIAANAIVINAC